MRCEQCGKVFGRGEKRAGDPRFCPACLKTRPGMQGRIGKAWSERIKSDARKSRARQGRIPNA